MKHGLLPALICAIVFLSTVPACWGNTGEQDVLVYLRGEEIKLSLSFRDGRFYGIRQEMSQLVPSVSNLTQTLLPADREQWVPLRTFWEELGFRVLWHPELRTIVVSDQTCELGIPPAALTVVEQAVSDTGWLAAGSEEALAAHLSKFYTPDVVAGLLADTWDFVKKETDWHSLYALQVAEAMDRGENWCLLKVTVSETLGLPEEQVTFHGLMKLEYLEDGWRIGAYRYFFP